MRDSALSQAAKRAVRILIQGGLQAASIEAPGLRLLLEIGLDLAERAYPFVQSYFDSPQTLEALQEAALDPPPGYDVHHIVEGDTAVDASEAARVNSPENEVAIPTLKHWEFNGWHDRPDINFDVASPRNYIKNRSWEEHQRVGYIVLCKIGVLK